jgi:hypothetical protein
LTGSTKMDFRDTARECETSFSTLCRTARRRLSGARRFFEETSATIAAAGEGAEQMVGRLAGVGDQQFKILAGGEPLAAFPFADGGDREARFGGDLFQRDSFPAPPFPEGFGKAPAKITFESRSPKHGGISPQAAAGRKKEF